MDNNYHSHSSAPHHIAVATRPLPVHHSKLQDDQLKNHYRDLNNFNGLESRMTVPRHLSALGEVEHIYLEVLVE